MARLSTIIVILSGVILLFNLFGLSTETSLVHLLLYPETYTSSALYTELLKILAIFVGVGVVSYFVSGSLRIDFIAFTPMVYVFLGFFVELLSIFNAVAVGGLGSRIFAALIISPLFILLLLAIMDWWRGVST